jgi:hypothetical protein
VAESLPLAPDRRPLVTVDQDAAPGDAEPLLCLLINLLRRDRTANELQLLNEGKEILKDNSRSSTDVLRPQ